jgi:hypothetical protein
MKILSMNSKLKSLNHVSTYFGLAALVAFMTYSVSAHAQYFPNLSGPMEDANVQLGSAGAIVSWTPNHNPTQPELEVLFLQNNSDNGLFTATNTGTGFGSPTQVPGITMGAGPGAAVLNGQLYVAYQSNDGANRLMVTTSLDGVTFTTPIYESSIPIYG